MLYLISMLHAPFENFTGIKFLFFRRSIAGRYWRVNPFRKSFYGKTLRNQWGMAGKWWKDIYWGRRVTRGQILFR
jgi:hypothetical protein